MKKNSDNIIRILKMLFSCSKLFPLTLLFLTVINSIIPFMSMMNTQNIMNLIQRGDQNNEIMVLIIMFVFLSTISLIGTSSYSYLYQKYNDFLYLKMNKTILQKTKDLSLRDYEDSTTYDLLQRAENEAGVRPISIFNDLIAIISALITMVSSVLILLMWKKWVIIGFIILPVFAFGYYRKVSDYEYKVLQNRTKNERKSWYISHLLTKDTFIKEVKLYKLYDFLFTHFHKLRTTFYEENVKINRSKSIITFAYQLSNLLFTFIIVIVGIKEAVVGTILVGNLMTYINTTSKVDNAISSIANAIFALYRDALYAENIVKYLDLPSSKSLKRNVKIKDILCIEFIDVSYTYANSNYQALKHIHIKIEKGDKIAIVGENGSGKSTFIKILSGLYTDYDGIVLVNGIDLKTIDITSLQSSLSLVLQDYNCYQYTVAENIGFGNIDELYKDQNIKKAAQDSHADEFINDLPHKYKQQVGNWFEGGVQLSGGQWQKLALARGFMRDAKMYILDEPTAALDPLSEYKFFSTLSQKSNHSICLFITHRYSNARIANCIYVFEKGEIKCHGSHEQLLSYENIYKYMYQISKYTERGNFNAT